MRAPSEFGGLCDFKVVTRFVRVALGIRMCTSLREDAHKISSDICPWGRARRLGAGDVSPRRGACASQKRVQSRAYAPPQRPPTRSPPITRDTNITVPAAHTLTHVGGAKPPCRGAYQTGLPHSRGELPEHIDYDHTASQSRPAGLADPRRRSWSVRNTGRHTPTAQHDRLLGLALPAHRCPSCRNRGM